MDFDEIKEELTYMMAVEAVAPDTKTFPELVTREISAATWAVFPSIGAMPDAIHKVWGTHLPGMVPGNRL